MHEHCEPQISVTVLEVSDGSLIFQIDPTTIDGDLHDIDGFFFNLVDDSNADSINVFPFEGTGPITDFETGADSQDSLSNGATLNEEYDAKLQFGTSEGSTEGEINSIAFTLWSDDGPLSIDDIDLDSMATVIDSDTTEGMVLTPNDGEDNGDDPEVDPDTCTFLVEGGVNVEVVMTELENGDLQVELNVLGGDDPDATGEIGDLRGFFFDVEDDSVLSGISVSGDDVNNSQFSADNVNNLGHGVNMNGRGANETGNFDGGVEIGTPGIGSDDIQSTVFTLSHPDGLSLEDFVGQDIGLRLTSVGEEDGAREESLKLIGECTNTQPEEPECDDQYALDNSGAEALMALTAAGDDAAQDMSQPTDDQSAEDDWIEAA